MNSDHSNLITLRVSVARAAQNAGVSLESIGLPDDADYNRILAAAQNLTHGWNGLASLVSVRAGLTLQRLKQWEAWGSGETAKAAIEAAMANGGWHQLGALAARNVGKEG